MKKLSFNLIQAVTTVYMLVSCERIWANECSQLFTVKFELKGNTDFNTNSIHAQIPITKAHMKSLEKSGILKLRGDIDDPRTQNYIPLSNAKNILNELWQRVGTVTASAVSTSQKVIFSAPLDRTIITGEPLPDSTQASHLENLKSRLTSWISRPDSDFIPRFELNRISFAVTMILAHINGQSRPKLDGTYQIGRDFPKILEDFSVARELQNAYPTFSVLHPETVLYLVSRGTYAWQVAEHIGSADGRINVEPYGISYHDQNHIGLLIKANREIPVSDSSSVFDTMWSEYINRPNQTWRQRELSILLIFDGFFESANQFSLESLANHIRSLQRPRDEWFAILLERLNDKNDFGTPLIHQQPVTAKELVNSLQGLSYWLESKRSAP